MNKTTPLRLASISRAMATPLARFALFLGALCAATAFGQTQDVVAQGKTDACYESRDMALSLARMDAKNDANSECQALGTGWTYSGMKFPGYEQCTSCKSAGFRCAVTQARHTCTNPQKEREEKAAKARAEKEAADKAAKAKADEIAEKQRAEKAAKERAEKEAAAKAAKARADEIAAKLRVEKAAKERADKEAAVKADRAEQIARKQREEAVAKQRADKEAAGKAANAATEQAASNKARAAQKNSIDDAFAKMERETGRKPAAESGRIDAAFDKMQTYRREQEQLASSALKAKQQPESAAAKAPQSKSVVQNPTPTYDGVYILPSNGLMYTVIKPGAARVDAPTAKEECDGTINGQPGWRLPVWKELDLLQSALHKDRKVRDVVIPGRPRDAYVWTSTVRKRYNGTDGFVAVDLTHTYPEGGWLVGPTFSNPTGGSHYLAMCVKQGNASPALKK